MSIIPSFLISQFLMMDGEWNNHLEIFAADDRQFFIVVGRPRISDLNDFGIARLQISQPAALLLLETRRRIAVAAVLFDRIVGYVASCSKFPIWHRWMRPGEKKRQKLKHWLIIKCHNWLALLWVWLILMPSNQHNMKDLPVIPMVKLSHIQLHLSIYWDGHQNSYVSLRLVLNR